MGETIDDFIRRFGSGGEDDNERSVQAQQYYDKFVSRNPEDDEFNREQFQQGTTEYLGKLPDDQFQEAASRSYAQMEPQEQQGLVATLLAALQQSGVDTTSLAQTLGMSKTTPQQQLAPEEYAKLANYTRHEHPEAMKQVVDEKPWFLKALGNPMVLGALGLIASKWLRGRSQQ